MKRHHIILTVSITAYIYILKEYSEWPHLCCYVVHDQTATAQIIPTFLQLQKRYHECLWPMTENHYHQQLGKEGVNGKLEKCVIMGQSSEARLQRE